MDAESAFLAHTTEVRNEGPVQQIRFDAHSSKW
jgi:hypothetical protein